MKKIIDGKLYDTDSMILLWGHESDEIKGTSRNLYKVTYFTKLFFTKNSKEYILLNGEYITYFSSSDHSNKSKEDFSIISTSTAIELMYGCDKDFIIEFVNKFPEHKNLVIDKATKLFSVDEMIAMFNIELA